MRYLATFILLTVLVFISNYSFSQTDFLKVNQQKIDSIKSLYDPACKLILSSKQISRKKIKYDKKLFLLMNDVYSKNLTQKEVYIQISKIKKGKWDFDSTNLGGTILYETRLPANGNLSLTISFATFENKIVYKQISFSTGSRTDCSDPVNYSISTQDLNYLATICIPHLNIPLHMCWNCEVTTSDTIFYHILQDYGGNDYILFKSDTSKLINYFTWHDIHTYMNDYVVEEIATLVKTRNVSLLKQLLYSPNCILAIYSMEALTFLEISDNEPLTDNIHKKMSEIQDSNIPINYQYSDVVRRDILYKELKISKTTITNKYKRL